MLEVCVTLLQVQKTSDNKKRKILQSKPKKTREIIMFERHELRYLANNLLNCIAAVHRNASI